MEVVYTHKMVKAVVIQMVDYVFNNVCIYSTVH